MLLSDKEPVIGDHNWQDHVDPHSDADGTRKKGLIPRNYATHPTGCYRGEVGLDAVPDLVSFSPSDFPAMIKELVDTQSRLSDFRAKGGPNGGMIPARDQNGRGYCWRHSPTSAQLLIRARDDMPYVDLSAYAGACLIKNYRDQGGWGAQGLDDLINGLGDPSSEFWPQRATDRKYDTPAMRANAKLHRISEGWIDMGAAQYDRNLSFNQVITCLLCRVPVVADLSWWGHSICYMDAVDGNQMRPFTRGESGKLVQLHEFRLVWGIDDPVTGGIGVRQLNSWGDSWGERGAGILTGQKAIPDGATAPRVATWSPGQAA
jgi:hypothetical protein